MKPLKIHSMLGDNAAPVGAPFAFLNSAELNGDCPAESPDCETADLHRSREIELLLAGCLKYFS
jgi:hypothetical protein